MLTESVNVEFYGFLVSIFTPVVIWLIFVIYGVGTINTTTTRLNHIDEELISVNEIDSLIVEAEQDKEATLALLEDLRTIAEGDSAYFELQVVVLQDDIGVRLIIGSEYLFNAGSTNLSPWSPNTLQQIAPPLIKWSQVSSGVIRIEGHTDDVPIQTRLFSSNWELSSARATRVARFLIDSGVSKYRIEVASFADTRPRSTVDQSLNRRIEIFIAPKLVQLYSILANE